MSPADWTSLLDLPWLSWSIGGLIAAIGLILLYRALFSDRPRGRRRCPKCWYDMRGTPSLRCPECGHTPKSERRLHRTRRYWRWASLATLCCLLGVSVTLVPKVRRDGWLSIMPTAVLLVMHPTGPEWPNPKDPVLVELDRRNAAMTLFGWQWKYLFRNKQFVRFRASWPAGTPLTLETCALPPWLSLDSFYLGSAESELPYRGLDSNHHRWQVAPPKLGRHGVQVPAGFERSGAMWRNVITFSPDWSGWHSSNRHETVWAGAIELPIRIVDRVQDAITPRGGINDAIRRATRIAICGVDGQHGAEPSIMVHLILDRTVSPALADIGCGFVGEFQVEQGATRCAFDQPGTDVCIYKPPLIRSASAVLLESPAMGTLRNSRDWTLILRGDSELALRDWDKTAYWDGQITLSPDEVWIEGRDPVEELQKPRLAKSP